MKFYTRQSLALGVAARWGEQYAHDIERRTPSSVNKYEIHQALLALTPEETTPERVAEIIGNGSWTSLNCHECGARDVPAAVEVGEELDYDSSTANVCIPCLRKAMALAEPFWNERGDLQ